MFSEPAEEIKLPHLPVETPVAELVVRQKPQPAVALQFGQAVVAVAPQVGRLAV